MGTRVREYLGDKCYVYYNDHECVGYSYLASEITTYREDEGFAVSEDEQTEQICAEGINDFVNSFCVR